MALDGSRLTSTLAADYFTQLKALFPIPGALLAAEKTAILDAQQKLANALANAGGPDIVTEVKLASVASTGVVTTGAGAGGALTASGVVS